MFSNNRYDVTVLLTDGEAERNRLLTLWTVWLFIGFGFSIHYQDTIVYHDFLPDCALQLIQWYSFLTKLLWLLNNYDFPLDDPFTNLLRYKWLDWRCQASGESFVLRYDTVSWDWLHMTIYEDECFHGHVTINVLKLDLLTVLSLLFIDVSIVVHMVRYG